MKKRKVGKIEAAKNKRIGLYKNFQQNSSKCIKSGIIIAPECVTYNSVWRIVIEKRDEKDNVKERVLSDPKFYHTPDEYEIKIMEITAFYAESLEKDQ